MTKDKMLKALSEFFASKGVETMTISEYKSYGQEAPIKAIYVKRQLGSWKRVIAAMNKWYPVTLTPVVKKEKPKAAPKKKVEKKDVE